MENRTGRTKIETMDQGGMKAAIEALKHTTRPCIDPMEIAVYYPARIARVLQVERNGEAAFVYTRSVKGKPGHEHWENKTIDAFEVREEFFAVKTARDALNFLRDTGAFLPYNEEISWTEFQRWQRLANAVREHATLAKEHRESILGKRPSANEEMVQIQRLLAGYPHTFFGPNKPDYLPSDEEAKAMEGIQAALSRGQAVEKSRQKDLERWFYSPPPECFSINFIPRQPEKDAPPTREVEQDGVTVQESAIPGGFLPQLFWTPEQIRPILVIYPRCTLEAIAGSIWAERVAGTRAGKCPNCNRWFKIGSQKTRTYCDDPKCRAAYKKRRQRAAKGLAGAPKAGKTVPNSKAIDLDKGRVTPP